MPDTAEFTPPEVIEGSVTQQMIDEGTPFNGSFPDLYEAGDPRLKLCPVQAALYAACPPPEGGHWTCSQGGASLHGRRTPERARPLIARYQYDDASAGKVATFISTFDQRGNVAPFTFTAVRS